MNKEENITQEFIWNRIVPIVQRFDPKYVTLMPMGFFYDTQPKEWIEYFEDKQAKGERSCLSQCWKDLGIGEDVGKAYTNYISYSKEKWECIDKHWTWDYFKDELFSPIRKEVVWDSVLLNLKNDGMGFSRHDPDGEFCKKNGPIPSNFDLGIQIGILLHPESHYKGWANCKMWYEY